MNFPTELIWALCLTSDYNGFFYQSFNWSLEGLHNLHIPGNPGNLERQFDTLPTITFEKLKFNVIKNSSYVLLDTSIYVTLVNKRGKKEDSQKINHVSKISFQSESFCGSIFVTRSLFNISFFLFFFSHLKFHLVL